MTVLVGEEADGESVVLRKAAAVEADTNSTLRCWVRNLIERDTELRTYVLESHVQLLIVRELRFNVRILYRTV